MFGMFQNMFVEPTPKLKRTFGAGGNPPTQAPTASNPAILDETGNATLDENGNAILQN